MSDDIPIEKRFKVLVEITRASHFAWREAVQKCCPDIDPVEIVNEMWEITGVQTGTAYLKHIDPDGDLPRQVAASIVWSSQCMGENAKLEEGEAPGEWHVVHDGCPWHRWHAERDLLAEDRPGCDRWFAAAIRTINEHLGTSLTFETIASLPDGDDCCRRRIREE